MRRKRKAAGRSCVWVGYGREKEKRKSSYAWVMGKKKKGQRMQLLVGGLWERKRG